MNRVAVAVILAAAGSTTMTSPAGAQCPTTTPAVKLNVPNPGSRATGSTKIAADTDIVVTEYVTGFQGPINVQVFRKGPSGWGLDTTFVPAGGVQGMAVQGDLIALVNGSGTLTMYKRNTTTNAWASVGSASDSYNKNIFFSGSTLAAGSGSTVKVFNVSAAGGLTPTGTVASPQPGVGNSFGFDFAYDGDLIAVSAIGDDTAGQNAGAAYVFHRVNGTWQSVQKLLGAGAGLHFGQGIALHNGRLAVSAARTSGLDDPGGITFESGYVRIYEWDGAAFNLAGHFTYPTSIGPNNFAFGHDVAIRGDRVIVTAFLDNLTGPSAGSGFIFDRMNGAWSSHGTIGLTGGSGGWFGSSIIMTNDHAFATAPLLSNGSLAVAVFDRCSQPPLPGEGPRCLPGITGLVSYLIAFFRADPAADYNLDGAVNASDVFAFLRDWFAGCP